MCTGSAGNSDTDGIFAVKIIVKEIKIEILKKKKNKKIREQAAEESQGWESALQRGL